MIAGRPIAPPDATSGLPFAHLNLRRNPFGEIDVFQRPEFAVVDVAAVCARLRQPGCAVQFMGDKGHGKTTHLVACLQQLPGAAYVHIGEGACPPIPEGAVLLIDEYQRLSRAVRRQVARRGVSLVLGTHADYRRELERRGFAVHTIYPGRLLDAQRLRRILNRRIQWSRRGAGAIPRLTRRTVEHLLKEHGADIRGMEAVLYDRFQRMEDVQNV